MGNDPHQEGIYGAGRSFSRRDRFSGRNGRSSASFADRGLRRGVRSNLRSAISLHLRTLVRKSLKALRKASVQIPSGPHRMEARSTSGFANVRSGWKADNFAPGRKGQGSSAGRGWCVFISDTHSTDAHTTRIAGLFAHSAMMSGSIRRFASNVPTEGTPKVEGEAVLRTRWPMLDY